MSLKACPCSSLCLSLCRHTQGLRAGPPHLPGGCCCCSLCPQHSPGVPFAHRALPAEPAPAPGTPTNTGNATQSQGKAARSSHLMALICALVRAVEHNYILALKRGEKGKKKKRLYFDVLVFGSQHCVLKGNYGNLSFQFLLSTAEKRAGIAPVHLHFIFSSSASTRIQPKEPARAAQGNKTSRNAERKQALKSGAAPPWGREHSACSRIRSLLSSFHQICRC